MTLSVPVFFCEDRYRYGHSRTKDMLRIWLVRDDQLDRNTLNDFYEVPGSIFRRQQAEARAGRRRNAVHAGVKDGLAIGINLDFRGQAGTNLVKLCLLEIRNHPDVR